VLNPIRLLVLSQLALRVNWISIFRLNRHRDRHYAFRRGRLDQGVRCSLRSASPWICKMSSFGLFPLFAR